ncbi:MAG: acyl-CoA dehydrogenase family protein, partial [Planctomycetota bacterium]
MSPEVPRDLPYFLGPEHAELAERVRAFRETHLRDADESDVNARGREIVVDLGKSGLLRHVVPAAYGGALREVDVRSLCVIREGLAYAS